MPREEGMVLDVGGSVDSQPMSRIPVEQADEERPSFGAYLLGEAERVLEDLAVHLVGVLVVEGRKTSELRENDETQGGEGQFEAKGQRRDMR